MHGGIFHSLKAEMIIVSENEQFTLNMSFLDTLNPTFKAFAKLNSPMKIQSSRQLG